MNGLATIAIALLGSGLVAAVPALIGTLRTLKANKPKTSAEAESAQATANRTDIGSLRDIIAGLNEELQRVKTAAEEERQRASEERAQALQDREEMRQEIRRLNTRVDEYEEQDTLQERELTAANLRATSETEQNRILRAHLKLFNEWAQAHYDAGHPPGMKPPPQFFD